MKVICISGKARSGKDTSAEIIKKLLLGSGKRVLITHYADLLKFVCKSYFRWDGNKDERGRNLLQHVGTDIFRAEDEDFWVRFVCRMILASRREWDYVIIPDARFPNEITYLKDKLLDVTHIRIIRDEPDEMLTDEQKAHSSETALDNVVPDKTIYNNGTIADTFGRWTL